MKNILIAFTLILFTACNKDDAPKDYSAENDEEIQAYIASNNLAAQKSSSGLYYIIDEQGTGDKPTLLSDRVKVALKGYLTNGTVFSENTNGISFPVLQELIPGLVEGLSYFNEGGKGKLIIPAHLAYGDNKTEEIPPGSVIIFDIELIYVNYKTENDEEIQTYLNDNDLIAEKSSTGLYYIIDELGSENQPTQTDNVTVAYKGYFLDGTVFDQSNAAGVSFNLQNVISGWTEGITYFKEGGNGKLLIPAHLAYGNSDYNGIPGGSVLIFDVNLISVN
ncbi:FKBP-type peptidyl-prolyl cis-trans isomerase [Thalassobellus citreus]|uniref:FKBP-type peptidyl-prolyl cis-trans isomerase n=1 Tax=Thalassobellus citreus TaxID=3367752 RepID=UPI00378D91D7